MGKIIYSPNLGQPPHKCEADISYDVFIHAGSIYECSCGKWLHCYHSSRRNAFDQDKWSLPDFYEMSWWQRFMARLTGKVKVDDLNNALPAGARKRNPNPNVPRAIAEYTQPPKRIPPSGGSGQAKG